MKQVIAVATLTLIVGLVAAAQQPAAQPQAGPDMQACRDMMARHDSMMKEMQAMDARLQEQVTAMQAAQGQAKVDAVARVVSTLAEQRTQERSRMMAMHEQMMAHMMSHMGQGAAAMQQCPMMQHMMKGDAQQHQH